MSTAARYHPGESAAHDLAGLADQAERSRLAIGDTFPAAAVEFLAAQPMVVLGAADSDGRVWASLLTGQPGFLTVTGDRNLRVRSRPAADDPLRPVLQAPAHVGLLALEPGSRRRMRQWPLPADRRGAVRHCPPSLRQLPQVHIAAPARCPRAAISNAGDQLGEPDRSAAPAHPDGGHLLHRHPLGRRRRRRLFPRRQSRIRHRPRRRHAVLARLHRQRHDDDPGKLAAGTVRRAAVPGLGHRQHVAADRTARTDWQLSAAAPGEQRRVQFAITGVVELGQVSPLRWTPAVMSRHNPRPPQRQHDRRRQPDQRQPGQRQRRLSGPDRRCRAGRGRPTASTSPTSCRPDGRC